MSHSSPKGGRSTAHSSPPPKAPPPDRGRNMHPGARVSHQDAPRYDPTRVKRPELQGQISDLAYLIFDSEETAMDRSRSAWEDVLGRSKNPEDVPEFLVQRTEGGDSAGNSARIGGTSIRKFIRAR